MKKNFIYMFFLLLAVGLTTSCLKDTPVVGPDAPGSVTGVVEFKNPSTIVSDTKSPFPIYVLSYDLENGATQTQILKVGLLGGEKASSDITVNLAVDTKMLDTYTAYDEETEFDAFPSSLYSFPASVTIKAGETTADVPVIFQVGKFDLSLGYGFPLKITSVSKGAVSTNFGSIILEPGAKNKYDGIYQYTTSATTALVPNANKQVTMVTVGPNTVRITPGLLATYTNVVDYTVDPATNKVTVKAALGSGALNDDRSKYDPATKTFTVYWKQANNLARSFEEKFVFVSKRP